ncbi:Heme/hemopexin-binding protein precursor [compost metagenome]
MNRIYRLVYNHTLGLVQVASELGASPGATSGAAHRVPTGLHLTPLALGLLLSVSSLGVMAQSLPSGGNIVSGSGQIGAPSGNQLIINQASDKLAINWQSFNIGAGQKVTFNQPGANSIALNRVLGVDGSKIMGQLDANGRVFLVNPNGVLFGASAQVNVGGLVASTLGISDADFAAGNYRFKGDDRNAAVINHGSLNTSAGGAIALLGGTVSNQGVIVANQGSVALAAGNAMTLDFAGNGLLNVQVDEAMVDALVENHQLIKADGGQVLLTAHAGDALLKTVINNTGVIQARTLGEKDGKIVLLGSFDGGTVQVDGTLDASAPHGGDGGFIDTSGAHVQVADTAKVTTAAQNGKTGTWLIDPTDFTISAGSAAQTASGIGADTLANNLANSNITLQTVSSGTEKGDIHLNSDVSYSQNKLTLNAHNNVNINATISVNGSGTLALNYGGTAGSTSTTPVTGSTLNVSAGRVDFANAGTGLLTVNGHAYTVINSLSALQGINSGLSGNYALGGNIDASATAGWNGGQGFNPIGTDATNYTGIFDGLGHTLSGLTIVRPGQDSVGLFGVLGSTGTLRNIGLLGGSITGRTYVGGLVGDNSGGSINNAYATSAVSGTYIVGGLVGINDGSGSGILSNVYAIGTVGGANDVGGLVGVNLGAISNAYAAGAVSGTGREVGGLVGLNNPSGKISNTYGTGAVSGTGDVGGLVGKNDGSISSSYWNKDSTGQAGTTSGATGLTAAQMMTASSFIGWDLATSGGSSSIWRIYEGQTAPLLRSFLKTVTVTTDASGIIGKTYDGSIASGTTGFTTDVAATLNGYLSYATSSKNAGTYRVADGTLMLSGLYSGQQGYDIRYGSGLLTIMPKALTVGGVSVMTKTYDGTTAANVTGGTLIGLVSGESLYLSGQTGVYNDKNAGNGKAVTVSGATLGDGTGLASNYTVSNATGVTGNITPKALTLSGVTVNDKIYDGTRNAVLSGGTLSGMVGSETLSLGTLFGEFGDKNAGNGKTVRVTSGSLGNGSNGGSASNYTISNTPVLTGNISKATISGITGLSALDKIYNGNLNVSLNPANAVINGKIAGDDVQLFHASGAFTDKNVGTNKTVNISNITLSGSDLSNYEFIRNSATATANITPKALAITGVVAANKMYDATTNATITGGTLSGLVSGETLSLSGLRGAFADKNAGTGKVVTISGATLTDGTGLASNYTISTNPTSVTADINRATISSVTNLVADSKVYDGGTSVTFGSATATFNGMVSGDSLAIGTATAAFSDKNAGTGKAVNISSLTLGGADAGNYVLASSTATGIGTITPKALTVTGMTATTRAYDGTLAATLSGGSLRGLVSGETLVMSGGTGTFADKNAGTGKTVTVTGVGIADGTGLASNYTVNNPSGVTGNITPKVLTIIGLNAFNKTYDGTTAATLSGGSLNGLIGSETIGLNGLAGTFDSANAGTGKAITVTAALSDGSNGGLAGNYSISPPTGLTADINKAGLTITAGNGNKTYGQTGGLGGYSVDGLLNNDAVSSVALGSNGTAATANVGNYTITVSNADGTGLSNYDITYTDGVLSIGKAGLTITANNGGKTYGQNGGLAGYRVDGLLNNDAVSSADLGSSGTAATANVGNYTITASNADGTGLSNYDITYTDGVLSIGKAGLTITANNGNKTYGQNGGLGGYRVDGLLNTDNVASVDLGSNGTAATANVGDYTITASNADGTGLSNYDITYTDGVLSIGKAGLTITANNASKNVGQSSLFNGYTANGLVNGDVLDDVRLSSNGNDVNAQPGAYAIVASDARGAQLGNYDITYREGTLDVVGVPIGQNAQIGREVAANLSKPVARALTDSADAPLYRMGEAAITPASDACTSIGEIGCLARQPE